MWRLTEGMERRTLLLNSPGKKFERTIFRALVVHANPLELRAGFSVYRRRFGR